MSRAARPGPATSRGSGAGVRRRHQARRRRAVQASGRASPRSMQGRSLGLPDGSTCSQARFAFGGHAPPVDEATGAGRSTQRPLQPCMPAGRAIPTPPQPRHEKGSARYEDAPRRPARLRGTDSGAAARLPRWNRRSRQGAAHTRPASIDRDRCPATGALTLQQRAPRRTRRQRPAARGAGFEDETCPKSHRKHCRLSRIRIICGQRDVSPGCARLSASSHPGTPAPAACRPLHPSTAQKVWNRPG